MSGKKGYHRHHTIFASDPRLSFVLRAIAVESVIGGAAARKDFGVKGDAPLLFSGTAMTTSTTH